MEAKVVPNAWQNTHNEYVKVLSKSFEKKLILEVG